MSLLEQWVDVTEQYQEKSGEHKLEADSLKMIDSFLFPSEDGKKGKATEWFEKTYNPISNLVNHKEVFDNQDDTGTEGKAGDIGLYTDAVQFTENVRNVGTGVSKLGEVVKKSGEKVSEFVTDHATKSGEDLNIVEEGIKTLGEWGEKAGTVTETIGDTVTNLGIKDKAGQETLGKTMGTVGSVVSTGKSIANLSDVDASTTEGAAQVGHAISGAITTASTVASTLGGTGALASAGTLSSATAAAGTAAAAGGAAGTAGVSSAAAFSAALGPVGWTALAIGGIATALGFMDG